MVGSVGTLGLADTLSALMLQPDAMQPNALGLAACISRGAENQVSGIYPLRTQVLLNARRQRRLPRKFYGFSLPRRVLHVDLLASSQWIDASGSACPVA